MAEFTFDVEITTSVRVTVEADTEQQARKQVEYMDDYTLTGETANPNVAVEVTDSDRDIRLITLTEQESA